MTLIFYDILFAKIVIISILLTNAMSNLYNMFYSINFKKNKKIRTVDKYYLFGEKRKNNVRAIIYFTWFLLHIFASIYIFVYLKIGM